MCAAMGLDEQTNVTLDTMVSAMVNVSNPPAAARALNNQLRAVMTAAAAAGPGGGGGATGMFGGLGELVMNCTEMPTAFVATAADIAARLYCGYYQSRCGGNGAQQLSVAYDWRGTDFRKCALYWGRGVAWGRCEDCWLQLAASSAPHRLGAPSPCTLTPTPTNPLHQRFEPDIFFNDTYGLPNGATPTIYQRIPQAVNMAVNSWLRTFVGEGHGAGSRHVRALVLGTGVAPAAAACSRPRGPSRAAAAPAPATSTRSPPPRRPQRVGAARGRAGDTQGRQRPEARLLQPAGAAVLHVGGADAAAHIPDAAGVREGEAVRGR
jgi:hypothetical protein